MSDIKVTDKPKYSFETRKDGKVIARYSVGINEQIYTTEYVHNNMGSALHGAKERYANTLKEKFPELESIDIDSRLGSPIREHPSAWRQRLSRNPQNEQQLGAALNMENMSAFSSGNSGVSTGGNQESSSAPSGQNLAQKQAEEQSERKDQVKGLPRNHVPFRTLGYEEGRSDPGGEQDGRNGKALKEPVPDRFLRPGEKQISAATFGGIDNNASITFGRDNNPSPNQIFSKNKENLNTKSLYSDHMGAGP